MTKSQTSLIQRETKTILKEIQLSLHIEIDKGEKLRLETYLGSKLLSIYHSGVSDGLQIAREVVFPTMFTMMEGMVKKGEKV